MANTASAPTNSAPVKPTSISNGTTSKEPATTPSSPSSDQEPPRQSQLATILTGLLIIASGLLIYNYFQAATAPATTSVSDQDQSQSGPTPSPTQVLTSSSADTQAQGSYVVMVGDTLWSIAEKIYGNGQRWSDLAAANALPLDSQGRPVVEVGQRLVAPDSAAHIAADIDTDTTSDSASTTVDDNSSVNEPRLTLTSPPAFHHYTVVRGDSLWSIAEKAYGNGALWTRIMNDPSNNLGYLANGRPLVHAGNQLYIP